MNYHWNWGIFFEPAPNGTGTYLDMLLSGLVLTIETAICAWILALVFGSIVGVLRTLPSKTAGRIGFAWVEFFRNMPLPYFFYAPGDYEKWLPRHGFKINALNLATKGSVEISVHFRRFGEPAPLPLGLELRAGHEIIVTSRNFARPWLAGRAGDRIPQIGPPSEERLGNRRLHRCCRAGRARRHPDPRRRAPVAHGRMRPQDARG